MLSPNDSLFIGSNPRPVVAASAAGRDNHQKDAAITKQPWLQWVNQTSATVVVETTAGVLVQVEVYETARVQVVRGTGFPGQASGAQLAVEDATIRSFRGKHVVSPNGNWVHKIPLHSLKTYTTYNYCVCLVSVIDHGPGVGSKAMRSDVFPFRTAPPHDANVAFSFAACAEFGGSGTDQWNRELFEVMSGLRPDLLLFCGDVVSNGGNAADWSRYFFGPGEQLLARTPFFITPGNHEELHATGGDTGLWEGPGAMFFSQLVHQPPHHNFFCFQWGNAKFIALDSTALATTGGNGARMRHGAFVPGAEQYDFLIKELAKAKANNTCVWTIVFLHFPMFVSADYQVDCMQAICPILEGSGVDLVLMSHSKPHDTPIAIDCKLLGRCIQSMSTDAS